MAELGITAIVVGAMLFALDMIPGLLAALMKGLQGFRGHVSQSRGPIYPFQTDLPLSGEAWLLGAGALMMIFGLQAFMSS